MIGNSKSFHFGAQGTLKTSSLYNLRTSIITVEAQAQSSAPDRWDERATGGEPPRYRLGAGVSVMDVALQGVRG